jgi:type IV pilus biogenesis protein PilP
MSRHVSHLPASSGWFMAALLALLPPSVGAQTIADYSRAQRALLETTMAQAAARSAGMGPSAPGPATASSVAASPSMPAPHAPSPPPAPVPAVQVSGVFASSDGAIAEIVVNATPYLLGAGQGVPGTAWHVESIAIDRVVLSRHGSVVAAAGAQALRRVFALPTLR